MNALTPHGSNTEPATMTSREIAELTGKEHKNVCRDIRNMLDALEKDRLSFEHIFQDAYGRDQQGFRLDRELTLTLVSGYDIPLRHRVVIRLAELEARPAQPLIPQTLPEALRLAADLADQRNIAQAALAIAAPKAEALDRIADAEGTMNPTVAAKALQVQPKKLFDFLREQHWIYRRPGGSGNVAYQDKIQAGYLTHKVTTVHREDGTEKVVEQVLVTGKGLAKLSQSFSAPT
jgi:phage antirepressor YoqD-like protein